MDTFLSFQFSLESCGHPFGSGVVMLVLSKGREADTSREGEK